MDLRQIKQL